MNMYDKISEEIKNDYYQQHYSNNGQRFVAWYVHNVLGLDRNQTKDAIIDGSNDKQIDAIVINNNEEIIHILQGKFTNKTISPKQLGEVLSSWIQLKDLAHLQSVGNAKLQSKLADVANALEDNYEVSFELITTAEFSKAAHDNLQAYQSQIYDDAFNATITPIDCEELERRYEFATKSHYPQIKHTIDLSVGEFMKTKIAEKNVVIATVPMKEAIKIPGIKDGSLFKKNVRQNLSMSNAVNKKISETIRSDKHNDFFFFHNGITAICNKMELDDKNLTLYDLSVVNGCQSLTAIYNCSETIRKNDGDYILFRFYEIPEPEQADMISINTNSQSAVKQRDLRSNDKRVLLIKKVFEQRFPSGYFTTKRGEKAPADKNKDHVIDLSDLGKLLVAWHSQRPNISYSETKIFDKCFDALFSDKKTEYKNFNHTPEEFWALNMWMIAIRKKWVESNPLEFDTALLALKSFAPYHHLYAVSRIFAIVNKATDDDFVPLPSATWEIAEKNGKIEELIKKAGFALKFAMNTAKKLAANEKRTFSLANWLKNKQCLIDINEKIEESVSKRDYRRRLAQASAPLSKRP